MNSRHGGAADRAHLTGQAGDLCVLRQQHINGRAWLGWIEVAQLSGSSSVPAPTSQPDHMGDDECENTIGRGAKHFSSVLVSGSRKNVIKIARPANPISRPSAMGRRSIVSGRGTLAENEVHQAWVRGDLPVGPMSPEGADGAGRHVFIGTPLHGI